MNVAVGCPVKNRAWILPTWFEYVDNAFAAAGLEPFYIFVSGTSVDDTDDVLIREMRNRLGGIVFHCEEERRGLQRQWSPERYLHMVEARNTLLSTVREVKPDYFLSLDSDILLREGALELMLEHAQSYAAVGTKVYLVPPPEQKAPNYAFLRTGLQRPDSDFFIPNVDILMAVKLMTPDAYNVDYETHRHGEDIGWSKAVRAQGFHLAWDGSISSKHVMSEEWLTKPDPRVGY